MANEFVAKNGLISQNNTIVSGSLTVTQGITGSLFGSASYALTASYALNAGGGSGTASTGSNASASFINQSTWTFAHNLNNRFVVVEAFDNSYNQIIPQTVTLTDANTVTMTFPTLKSGYAIASIGGANIITYQINNTASVLFATTGSNIFNGNQTVNGRISASLGFTGSLFGTASALSQTVINNILADALAYAVAL